MSFFNNQKGFTLVELLITITIIGLLMTVSLVGIQQARQKARDTKRMQHVDAIIKAIHL